MTDFLLSTLSILSCLVSIVAVLMEHNKKKK